MAPRTIAGGYGTVEGLPSSVGESHHFLEKAARDPQDRRRRWVKIGVTVGLALGAIAAICRAEVFATAGGSVAPLSRSSSPVQVMAATVAAEDGDHPAVSNHPAVSTAAGPSTASLAPLEFKALNFYHVRDGKPATDYPWLKDVKLIEPHRETTLTVSTPRDGFEYRWQICASGSSSDVHTSATGAEAVIMVDAKHLDENLVTLEELKTETGVVVRRLEEFVMVKYVRREIRTLTDDEREELLDGVSSSRPLSTCFRRQIQRFEVERYCTAEDNFPLSSPADFRQTHRIIPLLRDVRHFVQISTRKHTTGCLFYEHGSASTYKSVPEA